MDNEPLRKRDANGGLVDKAMTVLFRIAGLCLLGLMGLVFASVIFRYFLNRPIFAVEDVMGLLLGLTIFMAFPFVTKEYGHIKVDLLVGLFKRSPTLNTARLVLIDLGILAMVAFLGVQVYNQSAKHFARDSGTQAADIPLWPFSAAFAVLSAVAFLAFGWIVLSRWRAGRFAPDDDGGAAL